MINLIVIIAIFCGIAMPAAADVHARTVHVIIRADVNEVRLDTMYMLANSDGNVPQQICVQLPKAATNIASEDPNLNINAETNVVCKNLSAAAFDSIAVSYSLPNDNGSCKVDLDMPVSVDSVIVYLSGHLSKLQSSQLQYDRDISSQTKYSNVYVAKLIPADANFSFTLTSLPRQVDDKIYTRIALIGIALIAIAGIVVLFYSKDADGAGSQKSQ